MYSTIKKTKTNPIVLHSGFSYDYHLIIKELVEEFEGHFDCLGEYTEKYITFLVPIKKENESGKTVTQKVNFINSVKFMLS